MSKTIEDVGLIAAGIGLSIFTFGGGTSILFGIAGWASATTCSTLFSIGVSVGLAGTFGLLQNLLNPNLDGVPGSQQNSQNSAAYRRIIYGYMETGGVLTFDNTPSGNNAYQNVDLQHEWRHQVYTIAGHQITAFGKQSGASIINAVVIDGIYTPLVLDGSGYYVPASEFAQYGGNTGFHIAFEFDLGNPSSSGPVFPLLAAACPSWAASSIQQGCAKVHVAMRWDNYADGSQVANAVDLSTVAPVYVNGRVPEFRFQVTGKPLLDTRMPASGGAALAWKANTSYGHAQYIIDPSGNVQAQMHGPQGSFTSGFTQPTWTRGVTFDNQCAWVNLGTIHSGPWPGPGSTVSLPYVFTDPNGNLQALTPSGVGSVSLSDKGNYTTPPTASDGGSSSEGFGAQFLVHMEPRVGGPSVPPYQYDVASVAVISPGIGYPNIFPVQFLGGVTALPGGPAIGLALPGPTTGVTGSAQPTWSTTVGSSTPDGALNWIMLGVPSGFSFASNNANPALVIYDYLTNPDYGLAADPASIDLASFNAAANICEETVIINIASNGREITENLYACNGVFDQSSTRGDVLKGLLTAMAGTIVPPGDQWHVFAGAYNPPAITLTDNDLRNSIKGDFRISRRDICNGVKGTFIPQFLPANQTQAQPGTWRWTDFPPYQGNGLQGTPNYLAEDGGQVIWKDIRLPFTTSIWMAQRLAKIVLQLLRFQVTLHLACKLTAFPLQAGDTVTFIHDRWAGLASPPPTIFVVTQATIVMENSNGVPALGVDLILRQTDPAIYQFTAPSNSNDQGEYSQYATLGVI